MTAACTNCGYEDLNRTPVVSGTGLNVVRLLGMLCSSSPETWECSRCGWTDADTASSGKLSFTHEKTPDPYSPPPYRRALNALPSYKRTPPSTLSPVRESPENTTFMDISPGTLHHSRSLVFDRPSSYHSIESDEPHQFQRPRVLSIQALKENSDLAKLIAEGPLDAYASSASSSSSPPTSPQSDDGHYEFKRPHYITQSALIREQQALAEIPERGLRRCQSDATLGFKAGQHHLPNLPSLPIFTIGRIRRESSQDSMGTFNKLKKPRPETASGRLGGEAANPFI